MNNVFGRPFVFTDGLPLEAAVTLQVEYILVNIRGQQLVVIEIRYQRSCYKDYTGLLVHQKGNNANGNQSHLRCSEYCC